MRFQFRLKAAMGVCIAIGVMRSVAPPAVSALTPASGPASNRPTSQPVASVSMRRWFDGLADTDPKVREQAKVDLMGVSADELPALRQLVINHQPLQPAQASALHEIVVQSLLSSEHYDSLDGTDTTPSGVQPPYFLGILWSNQYEPDARLGVPVEERLPGFPSYHYLRTGDMILGIYMDPDKPLLQYPNVETHTIDQLKNAVGSNTAVQNIVLQVLRDGEQMRIAVKMAPRPLRADPFNTASLKSFTAERADRADAYWQENFAPLLESATAVVGAD